MIDAVEMVWVLVECSGALESKALSLTVTFESSNRSVRTIVQNDSKRETLLKNFAVKRETLVI